MKNGKITMTAIIGMMCLILTALIFMQVKTISQTDISELEIMRESELKTEITALKTKYDETVAKIYFYIWEVFQLMIDLLHHSKIVLPTPLFDFYLLIGLIILI